MSSNQTKTVRLEARLSVVARETLARAAENQGRPSKRV